MSDAIVLPQTEPEAGCAYIMTMPDWAPRYVWVTNNRGDVHVSSTNAWWHLSEAEELGAKYFGPCVIAQD